MYTVLCENYETEEISLELAIRFAKLNSLYEVGSFSGNKTTEIINAETGEIIATFSCGITIYIESSFVSRFAEIIRYKIAK